MEVCWRRQLRIRALLHMGSLRLLQPQRAKRSQASGLRTPEAGSDPSFQEERSAFALLSPVPRPTASLRCVPFQHRWACWLLAERVRCEPLTGRSTKSLQSELENVTRAARRREAAHKPWP